MLRIPGETAWISWSWDEHVAASSAAGTDFGDSYGSALHAMESGTVTLADNDNGGDAGRMVRIRHADGTSTTMCHASYVGVQFGQSVSKGQVVGATGASGFGSDRWYGPHVHVYGTTFSGVKFNLEPYIDFTNTAGGGAEPFPVVTAQGEDMIIYIAETRSADWAITAGLSFIQDGNGPLRPLSSDEYNTYEFYASRGLPYRKAQWPGDQIRKLTLGVGLAEWVGFPSAPADNNPVLTGRIIKGDLTNPEYPKVSTSVGNVTVDNTMVLNAVSAIDAKVSSLPTLSSITSAVNTGTSAVVAAIKGMFSKAGSS